MSRKFFAYSLVALGIWLCSYVAAEEKRASGGCACSSSATSPERPVAKPSMLRFTSALAQVQVEPTPAPVADPAPILDLADDAARPAAKKPLPDPVYGKACAGGGVWCNGLEYTCLESRYAKDDGGNCATALDLARQCIETWLQGNCHSCYDPVCTLQAVSSTCDPTSQTTCNGSKTGSAAAREADVRSSTSQKYLCTHECIARNGECVRVGRIRERPKDAIQESYAEFLLHVGENDGMVPGTMRVTVEPILVFVHKARVQARSATKILDYEFVGTGPSFRAARNILNATIDDFRMHTKLVFHETGRNEEAEFVFVHRPQKRCVIECVHNERTVTVGRYASDKESACEVACSIAKALAGGGDCQEVVGPTGL